MGKYWVIFKIALSERLVYRADFFISTFLRFIPIITTILLWKSVYQGGDNQTVGTLTYTQMVSYYLYIMVVRAFSSMPRLASDIANDIREGDLRKYLLQPINYVGYNLTLRVAHKQIYFVMAFAPYALVFWLCRDYLPGWPPVSALAPIVLSLAMAMMLGFLVNTLIGLLGFWFLEVASFLHIFMTIQYFLSGHMFPLTLLPDALHELITLMPFAYETYFPTMILLNKLDSGEVARVLLMQAGWVLVLFMAVRFAWHRGLRRYAAFGG